MDIANVTIIVRGTKGEVKKAMYNADGTLLNGEVESVLKNWRPAPEPPRPLDAPDEPISVTDEKKVDDKAWDTSDVKVEAVPDKKDD